MRTVTIRLGVVMGPLNGVSVETCSGASGRSSRKSLLGGAVAMPDT